MIGVATQRFANVGVMVRFVGAYYEHRIRLDHDGEYWRILFDPPGYIQLPGAEIPVPLPWVDDATYRTEDAAKTTALTLAQKMVHDTLNDQRPVLHEIDWRWLGDL